MLENWMNLELFFHLLCEKRNIKNEFYMQASITKICRTVKTEIREIMTSKIPPHEESSSPSHNV